MTKLGKWLVLINVALSLMFLAWAVGLYSNHINWATPPSDSGQRVQGMVDELKEQITRLVAARDSADNRWFDATGRVLALEMERPARQKYYADLTRSVRQGDLAAINPPVQQLEFDRATGRVVLKPTGRPPVEIDGQPALSMAGYRAAIHDKTAQISAAQQQVTALVGETEKLTRQVTGFIPPGDGERVTAEQKGLRMVLAEQEKLAHDLRLEQDYLRSPLTNYAIQTDLLRKRQAALAARLDELKATTAVGRR
jgi:hypothetical protein